MRIRQPIRSAAVIAGAALTVLGASGCSGNLSDAIVAGSSATTSTSSAPVASSPVASASASSASAAGAVGLTPPAPAGTTSFSWTTSATIKGDSTGSDYSGCPDGWYVRPAQPDSWGETTPNPSYTAWTSSSSLAETIGVGAELTNQYASSGLYQQMNDEFTNWSPDEHHDVMTIWCDKIPDWFDVNGDSAAAPAYPTSSAPPSTAHLQGCYLCSSNSTIQNVQSQQYLGEDGNQNAVMSDSPTNFQMQGDANGNSKMYNNTMSYGIWTTGALTLEDGLTTSGTTVSFTHSPNSVPAGGQFLMINMGAGGAIGAQLILNTSVTRGTTGVVGPGGECLADAGGTVTLVACDATDKSQYWNFTM